MEKYIFVCIFVQNSPIIMAKTRIDPSLPSSRLQAAIMAKRGFFEFVYYTMIRQETVGAKVFRTLYDTAASHPNGLNGNELSDRVGCAHSLVSAALIGLNEQGFLIRQRAGQKIYSRVNPVYLAYFQDFTAAHEANGLRNLGDPVAETGEGRRARV